MTSAASFDPNKYKTARSKPSQARGKERVRVILAAALELFKKQGVEEVTTNDIAASASIPIGSLYRYYPNKDSIINALAELYANDLSALLKEIGKHPWLPDMSWEEVFLLIVDAWTNYSNLNGPFTFLYAIRATPRLHTQNQHAQQKLIDSYRDVLKRRCPKVTENQLIISFSFTLSAVEMSMALENVAPQKPGPLPYQEAVGVIAEYMLSVCNSHRHALPKTN